jgi:hypothetical protein
MDADPGERMREVGKKSQKESLSHRSDILNNNIFYQHSTHKGRKIL